MAHPHRPINIILATSAAYHKDINDCFRCATVLFYDASAERTVIQGKVSNMVSKINALDDRSDTTTSNSNKMPDTPASILDSTNGRIVVALAHISGWSAEFISLKVKEKIKFKITPELVYDVHQKYLSDTPVQFIEIHKSQMKSYLKGKGFYLKATGRPMSEHLGGRPITVHFAKRWNSKAIDNKLLCEHYSNGARYNTVNFILSQEDPFASFALLTPHEILAVDQLGFHVTKMIKDVLSLFVHRLLQYIKFGVEPWKVIKWQMHSDSIHAGMNIFKDMWEKHYGVMAESPATLPDQLNEGTLRIKSTGQGAEFLLGLIISNRAMAADNYREWFRLSQGFLPVAVNNLPQDSQDCAICKETLGVADADGDMESAVRLIICCGQPFGRRCLMEWLGTEATCPYCRTHIPMSVIIKLLNQGDNE